MKKLFFVFTFLILVSFVGLSQDCIDFEKPNSNNTLFIEIISSKKFEKNKEEQIQKLKDVLTKDLQILMSEAIFIEVSGETKHSVSESKGQFSEYFQSQIKIETSTEIGFASIDFCLDQKKKTLWGKYKINKKELASATFKKCTSRLTALNAEINGTIYSDRKIDVQPIKKKYEDINKDFNTAIYLDETLDLTDWNALLEIYNLEIGRLANSQDQVEFESDFENAKKLLKSGSYYDGIVQLNRLKIDYSNNTELVSTLETAYKDYEDQLFRELAEKKDQREYFKALEAISIYCSVATCDSKISDKKNEIRSLYFDDESDKFKLAIKFDEYDNVQKHKLVLDKLADVNPKAYEDICSEYNDYNIKIGMNQAISNKEQGNYWESYQTIKELENIYGKRDSELKKLKSQVEYRILREEVKKEKSTRAKTLSFWIGTDLYFNDILTDSIATYSVNTYMFSYSAGLYWKYRFEKNYTTNYPVRSDFIGIKARMVDNGSKAIIPGEQANTPIIKDGIKPSFDIALDGYTFRVMHYAFGVNVDNNLNFSNPNYYQATLGFRLPLSIFSWNTDLNVRSQLQGEGYFFVSSGLHMRMDFNRKFNNKDKRKIKAEKFY